MEDAVKPGIALLTSYGLNSIGAILILLIGRMVAGWAQNGTDRWLEKSGKVDHALRGVFQLSFGMSS